MNYTSINNTLEVRIRLLELRYKIYALLQKTQVELPCCKKNDLIYLENELFRLTKSITRYDFIKRVSISNCLLVGEGNLSFTFSLIRQLKKLPQLIASTYESSNELVDTTKLYASMLKKIGVQILHGIDATNLNKFFDNQKFDTIIFQFPHSGSREPIEGVNPNYVLVRDFMISALSILSVDGVILVTIVDNDFYNNIFKLEELSTQLELTKPKKYKFYPDDYPEYQHTMTNQNESGIEDYVQFATWEFRP